MTNGQSVQTGRPYTCKELTENCIIYQGCMSKVLHCPAESIRATQGAENKTITELLSVAIRLVVCPNWSIKLSMFDDVLFSRLSIASQIQHGALDEFFRLRIVTVRLDTMSTKPCSSERRSLHSQSSGQHHG